MRSRVLLAFLVAGAVGMGALTAGEPPRPSRSGNRQEPSPLRPGELEQTPAGLAERCQKMLDLQAAVSEGTRGLHQAIQGTADKKPRPVDRLAARKLAAEEKAFILEATRAIRRLEAEGAAAAFTEFLESEGTQQSLRREAPAEVVALGPVGEDGVLAEQRGLLAAGRVPHQLCDP
jgi:hypothetical protein